MFYTARKLVLSNVPVCVLIYTRTRTVSKSIFSKSLLNWLGNFVFSTTTIIILLLCRVRAMRGVWEEGLSSRNHGRNVPGPRDSLEAKKKKKTAAAVYLDGKSHRFLMIWLLFSFFCTYAHTYTYMYIHFVRFYPCSFFFLFHSYLFPVVGIERGGV